MRRKNSNTDTQIEKRNGAIKATDMQHLSTVSTQLFYLFQFTQYCVEKYRADKRRKYVQKHNKTYNAV